MDIDWGRLLAGQLEFYWNVHLRPRSTASPTRSSSGSRSRAAGAPPGGGRELAARRAAPEPAPPPVTTIAWRLVHVGATCLANRASAFFGDSSVPAHVDMFDPRHVPADLPRRR